jgi:predicted kinase
VAGKQGREPLRRLALVVVGGLIASGKTTLAARLGEILRARVVSADAVREALYASGKQEAVLPGFSEQLYPELLRRAGAELEAGRTVVLDATFRSRRLRTAARELALDHGAAFRFVECRVDPAVCRERLRRREQEGGERGWIEMFEHFLALWEPVDELVAEEHRVVDTSGPLAQSLRSLELGV